MNVRTYPYGHLNKRTNMDVQYVRLIIKRLYYVPLNLRIYVRTYVCILILNDLILR